MSVHPLDLSARLIDTGDGLVAFDTSAAASGPAVVESLRAWSDEPVHSLVYTHGHLDHVGGSRSFAADAQDRGRPTPQVIGHENVAPRFDRYEKTAGYNKVINQRQFGGAPKRTTQEGDEPDRFLPRGTLRPDVTFGPAAAEPEAAESDIVVTGEAPPLEMVLSIGE